MDPRAIEKAENRLEQIRAAIESMTGEGDLRKLRAAWTDFLLHANTIYTSLEQGAKHNPKSRQWFGGKKKERKNDELLQYLHQARNSDEHGLDEIHETLEEEIELSPPEGAPFKGLIIPWTKGNDIAIPVPPGTTSVKLNIKRTVLATVHDRKHGNSYPPPINHRGNNIQGIPVVDLATMAANYLDDLIKDAKSLI